MKTTILITLATLLAFGGTLGIAFASDGGGQALDSTRRMYNPLTGSTIEIPDNVLWIAAINNGAQFTMYSPR